MKDIIVIGSGISGMTCACALANKGYNVTVLEKHSVAGGYCQSFSRKGFRFAAAVHRIGGIHGRNSVDGILSALGVKELPEWYTFHENVQVGDINFNMCNSSAADSLRELFPEDKEDIDRFEAEVDRINSILDVIDKGANAGINKFTLTDLKTLDKYRKMSVDQFLRGIFSNEKIISLLVAVSDAMPGGALFAFIRMVSFANCGEETYQPVGGAGAIIELLRRRIEELGGKVLLNSPAEKIIMEDGRAVGVVCRGEILRADYIVSNCDLGFTIRELVGEENVPQRVLEKIKTKFTESPSCFSVWIGLDKDIKTLGYEPMNISYYPDAMSVLDDKAKLIGEHSVQRENDFLLISLSANNDPTACPEGKGQMMLGMLVNWDFEDMYKLRDTDRKLYREKKKAAAMNLVRKAERFFPGISEHIEVMEIASPVTFQRYTGNSKGAFGGYKCTPELVENFSLLDCRQLVDGLFLTGHWGGVGDGVIFTTDVAMRVADKILRCDHIEEIYDFSKNHSA